MADGIVPHLLHSRPTATESPPWDDAPEAELVARARHDPREFAPLYRRYLHPVHQYCYRRLGSREAAEDATSQVFILALSGLHRYREGSFRGWLFTIAHHVVVDAYRARRPWQAIEDAMDMRADLPSPEELAVASTERDQLYAALADLPEAQRQVIELRLAGLTGPEIARVLGRKAKTVDVIQFRAMARLRGLLVPAPAPEVGHAEA